MTPNPLDGRRILLVEDEYLLVEEMASLFRAEGAEVVGPAATLEDALGLIGDGEPLDGAVLDINLKGQPVFPAADALLARGVPFLFATGYDDAMIPRRFARVPRCRKPFEPVDLATMVSRWPRHQ